MLVLTDNGIYDFELEFLRYMLTNLDSAFDELEAWAESCGDPDGFGIFDHYEFVAGTGFVCCQRYLNSIVAIARTQRADALRIGPQVANEISLASIINAAANYWKHADEWIPGDLKPHQANTKGTIEAVTPVTGYTCTNLLFELTAPSSPRFQQLVANLESWRDEVCKVSP